MDKALEMFENVQPGRPGWFWFERIRIIPMECQNRVETHYVVREVMRDDSGCLWLEEHKHALAMSREMAEQCKGPVAPYVSGEVLSDTFICGQCGWWDRGCTHAYRRLTAPEATMRACSEFAAVSSHSGGRR